MNARTTERIGLRLERFSHTNASMVLRWRNAFHVRANSLNDEVIRLEDHLKFVDHLKGEADRNFFIVHLQDTPVAVLNVNVKAGVGSWGCYLGGGEDRTVRPGVFPILIGVAGTIAFEVQSCRELHSDVLQTNLAPQTMNAFLGIPLAGHRVEKRPSGQEIPVVCYALTENLWPSVLEKMNKLLTRQQRIFLTEFADDPLLFID